MWPNKSLQAVGKLLWNSSNEPCEALDHAFIVAGGGITKAAKNWLGNKLDATKRSQIMFMDRDDLLNLFVVTNLPLPKGALPKDPVVLDEDPPF